MAFGALKGTLTLAGGSIGATNDLAGSVSVVVGDLVFVGFGQQTNLTCTGASDNLGNSYSALNAGTDAGTVTGRGFWSLVSVAGTLTTVTVAATGSTNDFAGVAAVIEGNFASSPLDANPANTSEATSPYDCPATGTLAQANEVVLCWIVGANTGVFSATSPNLLSTQAASSTNVRTAIGYQTVSSTSSVAPQFTSGSNDTVTKGTASFKKAPTSLMPFVNCPIFMRRF